MGGVLGKYWKQEVPSQLWAKLIRPGLQVTAMAERSFMSLLQRFFHPLERNFFWVHQLETNGRAMGSSLPGLQDASSSEASASVAQPCTQPQRMSLRTRQPSDCVKMLLAMLHLNSDNCIHCLFHSGGFVYEMLS